MVVAGAILHITFQLVVLFRQFNALREGRFADKETDGHVENRVVRVHGTRTGLQRAQRLRAFRFIHAERGTGGTSGGKVVGIDVPAGRSRTGENDVYGFGIHAFVAHAEIDLRAQRQKPCHQQKQGGGQFLFHVFL